MIGFPWHLLVKQDFMRLAFREIIMESDNILETSMCAKSLCGKRIAAHKVKLLSIAATALSLLNGILYFAIAREGANNLSKVFHWNGSIAEYVLNGVSGFGSVSYGAFFKITLDNVSLLPENAIEAALCSLAPFAASSFLAAGIEGSKSLGMSQPSAISIGVVLFVLRMINCVDGSTKFPTRVLEMKAAWDQALAEHNKAELSRIIVAGLIAIGYAASCTDPIYQSAQIILSLLGVEPSIATDAGCYTSSILGALGTLPMVLYWTHRGIIQATFGGRVDQSNGLHDPTDRYTLAALPLVISVTTGALGAATGSVPNVFGHLGPWTDWAIRIPCSAGYAILGGIPGVAAMLRPDKRQSTRSVSEPVLQELLLGTDSASPAVAK